MRTITKTVYTFDELSDEAKENAYNNDHINHDFAWDDAYRETLNRFCKIFDIKMHNWEVDYGGGNYDFEYMGDNDVFNDMTAARFSKWIYNNFYTQIVEGKYYSTKGKWINGKYNYKYRYSKIFVEHDCTLTGYFADCDILEAVFNCIDYKTNYTCMDDLIDDCLSKFFEAWSKDIEYSDSFEAYEEMANCNEWEYDENGERI
jgi:hypothetical protein